jgi:hypothetical protein
MLVIKRRGVAVEERQEQQETGLVFQCDLLWQSLVRKECIAVTACLR